MSRGLRLVRSAAAVVLLTAGVGGWFSAPAIDGWTVIAFLSAAVLLYLVIADLPSTTNNPK